MSDEVMKALRNKIVASGIQDVYIGDAPSLQLECVALKPTDGYASIYFFGRMELAKPLVEVVIRTKAYQLGQSWYDQVKKALDKTNDEEVGILSCVLTGSPGYLGRDLNGFGEWHMIFDLTLKE